MNIKFTYSRLLLTVPLIFLTMGLYAQEEREEAPKGKLRVAFRDVVTYCVGDISAETDAIKERFQNSDRDASELRDQLDEPSAITAERLEKLDMIIEKMDSFLFELCDSVIGDSKNPSASSDKEFAALYTTFLDTMRDTQKKLDTLATCVATNWQSIKCRIIAKRAAQKREERKEKEDTEGNEHE